MNIRWGHDFINHFIWLIFIRNYVTCYIFVFECWFKHTSAVSTDARRKYKITWSYRYSCESPEMGDKNRILKEEYIVLTDEQAVQAVLKHPNACRHVTLSDMHSLSTHTKACTHLVDTPRVSQCYYIPHSPTFSYTLHFTAMKMPQSEQGSGISHWFATRVWIPGRKQELFPPLKLFYTCICPCWGL